MSGDDLKARAQALRAAGCTPKQIARELGITRTKAVALVHSGGGVPRPSREARPEKQLAGCWVSGQWSNGLSFEDRPADWIDTKMLGRLAPGAGLVTVMVVREHVDNEVNICGFLVDTYCLGVKNALAPTFVARPELEGFLAEYFAAQESGYLPAPLKLVQHLVLGAVDFAAKLGFDPHPDFYLAKPHLGQWEPPCKIRFGLDGAPFYQQGPYDNPVKVLQTLNRSVGSGNYDYR